MFFFNSHYEINVMKSIDQCCNHNVTFCNPLIVMTFIKIKIFTFLFEFNNLSLPLHYLNKTN